MKAAPRVALALTLTLFSIQLRAVAPSSNPDDVVDAVAEYTLDPEGALYEEHSPQTELPHLESPKT